MASVTTVMGSSALDCLCDAFPEVFLNLTGGLAAPRTPRSSPFLLHDSCSRSSFFSHDLCYRSSFMFSLLALCPRPSLMLSPFDHTHVRDHRSCLMILWLSIVVHVFLNDGREHVTGWLRPPDPPDRFAPATKRPHAMARGRDRSDDHKRQSRT